MVNHNHNQTKYQTSSNADSKHPMHTNLGGGAAEDGPAPCIGIFVMCAACILIMLSIRLICFYDFIYLYIIWLLSI